MLKRVRRVDDLDGEEHGIIDVPGHEDFIRNMLAGTTGVDALVSWSVNVRPRRTGMRKISKGVLRTSTMLLKAHPLWICEAVK